jgi:hypothetical protein
MSQSDGDDSLDSVTETESLRNFVHDDLDENEDNSGMEQRAIEHAGAFQSNTNGKKGLVLTPLTMRKKRKRSEQREIGVTQERGRGDTMRAVSDYHDKMPFFLACSDFWCSCPTCRHITARLQNSGYEAASAGEYMKV